MFIKASDLRHLRTTWVALQILGLVVITWGFLIPTSLSVQILISQVVTFVIMVTEHIQSATTFSRKEIEASSWIYILTFRLAINKAILSAQRGEYCPINWEQVTLEAVEDIKHVQSDDKIYEELSSAGIDRLIAAVRIDWLIPALAVAALNMMIYPLIGYGFSLLFKTLVPGIAEGM